MQEHLFDVSDLQHEPQLISKCGSIEVSFAYDATKKKLAITIHRAREIPAKDRGGASSTQVSLLFFQFQTYAVKNLLTGNTNSQGF